MARFERFLGVVALIASLMVVGQAQRAHAEQPFLTRQGVQLTQDGLPFRFSGVNMFDANSTGWCGPDLQSGSNLSDALDRLGPGKNTVRAWFFQSMATTTDGHRDWSSFDHTLDVMAAHGIRVIATLTDQWGECGDGRLFGDGQSRNGYKDATWYQTGYKAIQPGFITSYRDFVQEVVTRYANDHRILFWQLINEAEVKDVGGGVPQDCPPSSDGPMNILRDWATDVSGLVRSIDANHLISLGTIGGGQCGSDGDRYQTVHEIPTIDLCEYHDYTFAEPVPGDQWNGLARRIAQCNAIGKPLFVGEMGVKATDVGGTIEDRAAVFDTKLGAQFRAGVQGILAWAYLGSGTKLYDYDIGAGEPVLDVLALPPTTTNELVSQNTAGDLGNSESGNFVGDVSTSRDGRFVSFSSRATNLAGPDTNGTIDVFLRDRALGTTTLESVSSSGVQANDYSNGTALNETGRYIAFSSAATNLVPGDTNGSADLFVRDRIYRTTTRVSVKSDGSQASGNAASATAPEFSADGRYIVFQSDQSDLVPGDNNNNIDVFLHDRDTDGNGVFDEPGGTSTTRISVATDGGDPNNFSGHPSISPNGRFISFTSLASNIVTPDADLCVVQGPPPDFAPTPRQCLDDFLLDRDSDGNGVFDEAGGTTLRRISEKDGIQADGESGSTDVSDTGDVAFWSQAQNLGATPGQADAFVYDFSSGSLEIVGRVISNTQSISDDGRYVAYDSFVSNGVPGDTNNTVDVFVHDRVNGTNQRISVNTAGAEVAGGGFVQRISGDGRIISFGSYGDNLVPNDTNGLVDVFVRDRLGPIVGAATPPGTDVPTQPVDANTGQIADVTFGEVVQPGITTLTTTQASIPPPSGFSFGSTYFDLSTTATFDGNVTACFTYDDASIPDESTLRLFHYESGAGRWVDVTTSLDTTANQICGTLTSFSPIAIARPTPDTTAPTITITSPTNNASYPLGSALTAAYSCDDGTGSGVATCAGTVANGAALPTTVVGPKTFTVRTSDNAGNNGSMTVTYSIIYRFQGFFSPVANPPTLNSVRTGSVPIPFSLTGNQGLDVVTPGTRSRQISCRTFAQSGPTAGAQGKLEYAKKSDRYTYTWSTQTLWKGTCRVFILALKDGTEHQAYFKFK